MKHIIALIGMIFTMSAYGHGYIQNSRSKLCAEGINTGCGAIQYEPQSVEGPDRFPATGPSDGSIASAGSTTWAALNEQTPSRWSKINMLPGINTFVWHFTANHVTQDWRYFITNSNWNPSQPLSRDSFDLTPFCSYSGNNQQPPTNLSHECNVPQREGYHVILGVWDVGDTAASFYQVMDIQFSGNLPNNTYRDIGDIFPSMQLSVNDRVSIRPFDSFGELSGQIVDYYIQSEAEGNADVWPKRVADNLNAQASQMIAGVENAQGEIVSGFGKNDIFVLDTSDIIRAEVEIQQDTSIPQPEITVLLTQTDYPADQALSLDFTVTTNQLLEVTAQLYFQGVSIDFEQANVASNHTFTMTLADPEVGAYDLVITAVNTAAQEITQETIGITVVDPINPNLPAYPSGVGSYSVGDQVYGQDGNLYECKVAGWCNGSAAYYAPGTGLAWDSAWHFVATGTPSVTTADYAYPDGLGQYAQATVVSNNGNLYRCTIPNWCNGSDLHYAPGTGLAWTSAWTDLGAQ